MKSINKIICIALLAFSVFGFASTSLAQATTTQTTNATPLEKIEYTTLAPLPGTTECGNATGPNCKTDLKTYIEGLFILVIGLASVLAVGWIIYGGIQYITSDAIGGKNEGRERIKNAIIGLVIVIASYLILQTINPRLLEVDLNISSINVKGSNGGQVTAGGANPCVDSNSTTCSQENAVRARLTGNPANRVSINADCTATACVTQVGGLREQTITGVLKLQDTCDCTVIISGGNEGAGHGVGTQHTSGTSLDIITNNSINQLFNDPNPKPCDVKTATVGGQTISGLYEPPGSTCGGTQPSTGNTPHWHVTF